MFIARVAYNLPGHVPPSSCCHGVCRFKVSGISSFRRFQTIFHNVLCSDFLLLLLLFLFSSRVSLLGFPSLYSAHPFQVGLFQVFSAPNLVFVVCVTFSLVFGIFCSYLFSMWLLPFGSVFDGVCGFFCPHVRRVILVLYFTFSIYFAVRVFSVCVHLRISCVVCRVFIHVRSCLHFLFRN